MLGSQRAKMLSHSEARSYRCGTEDNVPVLSYDWFEAAVPAPSVLAFFRGERTGQ